MKLKIISIGSCKIHRIYNMHCQKAIIVIEKEEEQQKKTTKPIQVVVIIRNIIQKYDAKITNAI